MKCWRWLASPLVLQSALPFRLKRCAEFPASGSWPGNRRWDAIFRLLNNVAMLVIACVVLANAGADLLGEDRRQPV